MANIHGIEVSGQIYDLEDTTARDGVQTNTNDIDDIQAVVPSSASESNKLATENDVPDISLSELVTVSSNGIEFKIRKSGKVCAVEFMGQYTGSSSSDIAFQQILPVGFRPAMSVRAAFFDNSEDVPYGQTTVSPNGTISLWGGDGDIQTDQDLAGYFIFLTE